MSPSVLSVYFRTAEIDIKYQRKFLAGFFQGSMGSSASFRLRYWNRNKLGFHFKQELLRKIRSWNKRLAQTSC